ncbi:hypothetical protein Pfo_028047, partial [Paulownia fortunei]
FGDEKKIYEKSLERHQGFKIFYGNTAFSLNLNISENQQESHGCTGMGGHFYARNFLTDISYKDSLMSYVKGLGPIAQMVAKRKLLGKQESNIGWIGSEKFWMKMHSGHSVTLLLAAIHSSGERGSINVDMVAKKGGVSTRNPVARDLNCSASNSSRSTNNSNRSSNNNNNTSFRDDNVRPVILALENSHSNVAEFKSKRNKKSCNIVPSPSPALGSFGESSAAAVSSLGHQQNQPLPLISQFTFDLPFLKARLNQMNALERGSGEFLKRPSYSYSSFEERRRRWS